MSSDKNFPVTQAGRGDYEHQWSHVERKDLIRATKDFVVVIAPNDRLDWETSTEYDTKLETLLEADRRVRNDLLAKIAVAEATPCSGFPNDVIAHFKHLLGEATVYCLERDFATAREMLHEARQYIRARNEETSRHWYLWTCAVGTSIFIIAGMILWIGRSFFVASLGVSTFWLAMAACAGAVGALLSVIARSGKLKFDACAGKPLHILEGCSRIIMGAVSGVIIALAVRADIIFVSLASNGRLPFVLVLAALAAGAGERLATSIISKFDDPQNTKENTQQT